MKYLKIIAILVSLSICQSVFALKHLDSNFSFVRYTHVDEHQKYIVHNGRGILNFKQNQKQEQLRFLFKFYQATRLTKNKLIVITPNIEGETVLEKSLAKYLAQNGYHVLVPNTVTEIKKFDESTYEQMRNIHLSNLDLTTMLIDFVDRRFNFDNQRMGLVGASLGGIRSSMLMGTDHRFTAMFISVAGADFPSIYANSEQRIVKDIRVRHMKYLNMTNRAAYEDLLRGKVGFGPEIVVDSPHRRNIAMIIADKDTSVPSVNQWELWAAIRTSGYQPRTYQYDVTHVTGALMLVKLKKDVLKFMNRRI